MPSDQGNGGPPLPEGVDPQDMIAQTMFVLVRGMAPPDATDEQVVEAMQYAAQMEMSPEFELAFDRLYNPEKRAARARWGVKLHHTATAQGPHLFHGPKLLNRGDDPPADVASFLVAFGCFNSPVVRAVLALHGYRVEFVEVATKPTSKIIIPH